jgi:hypothetical protein
VLFGHGTANTGDGTFDDAVFRTIGSLPSAPLATDFDEDGGPDLAFTHIANGQNLGVALASCGGSIDGSLHVTAPNGGEEWPVSSEQVISWSRGPRVTAVDVELSRDQGATWETIARGVTDTSLTWTVTFPSTADDQALLRVVDPLQSAPGDTSDAFFTIGPHPLLDAPRPPVAALAFERVYPNPARDRLMVTFALPRSGEARLELIDVGGRRIASRDVGALGAGRHTLDLARGLRLPSGLYFMRLTQGDRRITARAVVTR